jgi:hypothetical protein
MIPDLLRYSRRGRTVLQYSFTPDVLYLWHPRQLQNLGVNSKMFYENLLFSEIRFQ